MTVDTAGNLTARFREYLDEHIFTSLLQFDKSSDLNEILEQRNKRVENGTKQFQTAPYKALAALAAKPEINQLYKTNQDKAQNLQLLSDQFKFSTEDVEKLQQLARFQYDSGKYQEASELLQVALAVTVTPEKLLDALWGRLACEIMLGNWEQAGEELNRLRDHIENKSQFTHVQLLQQRTWLLHWSLFIYFHHPKGRDMIVDLFSLPQFSNTLQVTSPYLLRYLTAAVVLNKRRRQVLKDLVKVIQQELHNYRDPVTDFLNFLCGDCDFEGAQKSLGECSQLLEKDYFLARFKSDFIEQARQLTFETYCRIHQCIDIRRLSAKLNLDEEEGEKWIVNLIRNARLDAKIDSQSHTVIMGTQAKPVYQDLIERTKDISFRTNVLAGGVDKM